MCRGPLVDDAARSPPHRFEICCKGHRQTLREMICVTVPKDEAVAVRNDKVFSAPTSIADDDRKLRSHRFVDHQTPRIVVRRQHQQVNRPIELSEPRTVMETHKSYVYTQLRSQR